MALLPGMGAQATQAPASAFCRYFQPVIAAPPLPPAVQASDTRASPAVASGREGASGGLAPGVPVTTLDQSPAPAELAARTRTLYSVPSVRLG